MYVRTNLAARSISPAQVWAGLTTECRTRVIQLLARLASVQSLPLLRRPIDGDTPRHPEDPIGSP